jgi:hypothetical protein
MATLLQATGSLLARYLDAPLGHYAAPGLIPAAELERTLRPGDVILIEGNRRISVAIKYLTQSTWSHAALYVGVLAGGGSTDPCIVEADITAGVRAVPLSTLEGLHVRICRPVGLSPADCARVIAYAVARIGHRYDLKNVWDLARYLLPMPPVPVRFRRRLLSLGSGDPTRAICSTLIAQAFQSVRYPILPEVERVPAPTAACEACYREIHHIRHHSLFAPRDFDISPYFDVVKPRLAENFSYAAMEWAPWPEPESH